MSKSTLPPFVAYDPTITKQPKPSTLLHALEAHLGGRPFAAGQQLTTELSAPDWQSPSDRGAADGLRIKVTITVERRAPADDVARYRAELLAELADGRRHGQTFHRATDQRSWDVARARCECSTDKGRRCQHGPIAAVVYRSAFNPGEYRFLLVCGQHRKTHRVADPARIVAVVELAPSTVAVHFARGCEAWRHRREQAIAAARAAGKPVCRRCGVDGSCLVPPCDYEQRPAAPGSA